MTMAKQSRLQGSPDRSKSGQDAHPSGRPAFWLALFPVLLLPVGTAWAGSPEFGAGIDGRPAARIAVQPAQFSFKQRNKRYITAGKQHSHRFNRPKIAPSNAKDWQKDTSSRPPRDPPQRGPHDGHRHRPHLPPLYAYPRTATERAEYLASLPRRTQQSAQNQGQTLAIERQVVVLFNSDRSLGVRDGVVRTHGLERLSSQPLPLLDAHIGLLRIRSGRSEAAVLVALRQDSRVRSAQFNQRYFHTQGPSQAAGASQQADAVAQYGPRKVNLPEAHQLALGRKVAIAVIDSRVDAAHPDLKGAVVRSFDAAGGAPDTALDFHGTAVAGIIRARGIVEGVAPEAEILAVRAFRISRPGAQPETNTYALLTAVDWAVRNGAKVLNMSFTGPRDAALQEALEAADQKGVILIAAAGNAGPKAAPAFPAAYPGVIAVTAVDEADRRYQHANRGSYIAVAAPGVDILAPVERGRHSYLSGTSFAAAYVSGIAALLLERNPNLDAKALAELVATGADDLGPAGRDDDFGAGRVNAYGSLKLMGHGVAAR
jgi:Subtilase family